METQPLELYDIEKEYIKSLSQIELKTLEIARSHLGTSFNLKKSNGFINWIKQKLTEQKAV
jgi:transcriptional regulator CtsR